MTNQELADWLNAELSLTAADAVTLHVIRQWVGWGVLPRATGRGQRFGASRIWSRDDEGIQRARRLAELRKAGLKDEQALISQMWLEGWPIEFQRTRSALAGKFAAAKNRLLRPVTTNFDPRTHPMPTAAKQRAVANQIGPLDPIFQNSPFAMTKEELIAAFGAVRFGREAGSDDLVAIAKRMFKSIGEIPPEIIMLAQSAGVLGSEDEIADSAEQSLAEGDQPEFELARRYWQLGRRVWSLIATDKFRQFAISALPQIETFLPTFESVTDQIFVGHWAITGFAWHLHNIHCRRNEFPIFLEIIQQEEAEFNILAEQIK